VALDRWRTLERTPEPPPAHTLRFVGSHDPAVALVAARFGEIAPGDTLRVSFAGSLGGLIALAEGAADLAGSHLWDAESDTYNEPFVRRLLPGRRVALVTLAHRWLGLILPLGNPAGLRDLEDLTRAGVRFINRQPGAGTRVWLDAQLARRSIARAAIAGYETEASTHSEVARAVAEGQASVGLGVAAAAQAFGLTFAPLQRERYDLVVLEDGWQAPAIQALAAWLTTREAQEAIAALGGYETDETGRLTWVG